MRRIVLCLATAILLLTGSACSSSQLQGRPTVDQVAKGFKRGFTKVDPNAQNDPAFDKVAQCFGELIVESDLSDEAVQKLAYLNDNYRLTYEEQLIINDIQNEQTVECLQDAVGGKGEPVEKESANVD